MVGICLRCGKEMKIPMGVTRIDTGDREHICLTCFNQMFWLRYDFSDVDGDKWFERERKLRYGGVPW